MSRPLNEKQRIFAHEYLVDLNATQAAIRAGYSPKTAYAQGHRLLKHAEVGALVQKLGEERLKKADIDAQWLLDRLTDDLHADIADLYYSKEEVEELELDDWKVGALKPVHEWPKVFRTGLVAGIENTKFGPKVKISDRTRIKELLGKHVAVQAFKEHIEVDVLDRATVLGRARQRASKTE